MLSLRHKAISKQLHYIAFLKKISTEGFVWYQNSDIAEISTSFSFHRNLQLLNPVSSNKACRERAPKPSDTSH